MKLSERQKKVLAFMGVFGGEHSAARIGRDLNPTSAAVHGGGAATLRSLETLGLVKRRFSNTWSTATDLWSLTPDGKKAASHIGTDK